MKETAPKLSATDTFGLGPTLTLMFAHYRRSWDESKKWQQISLGFFLVFFLFFTHWISQNYCRFREAAAQPQSGQAGCFMPPGQDYAVRIWLTASRPPKRSYWDLSWVTNLRIKNSWERKTFRDSSTGSRMIHLVVLSQTQLSYQIQLTISWVCADVFYGLTFLWSISSEESMTFVNTHNTLSVDGSIVLTCVFVLKSLLKTQPHI